MTFFKEGRKLNYAEVVETLSMLIKQNILSQLETEEVYSLFIRLFNSTESMIENYLEGTGYRATNSNQAFFTASRLNIVPDLAVWDKAIEVKKDIELEKSELIGREMLITFISGPYSQAMKALNTNLENKQGKK